MCGDNCNGNEPSQECAICGDAFRFNEYSTLACGHKFHQRCLCLWFVNNASCPLCGSLELQDFQNVFENINKVNLCIVHIRQIASFVPKQYKQTKSW
ncbi:hypothetical protein B4U80_11369 [Leptotrombidium deliense]|uniref:RING-type domain-containing protein n=1 Tax=Leptotrombidium deliense TaxID=299467 RepID=A0A443RZB6_9ACAR|nr:hypothetical protein B4U80_11369 [Leptotrombidium deliense]